MQPRDNRNLPHFESKTIRLTVEEAFGLAFKLHQSGELDAAETIYQRVLGKASDHLDALHFYGLLCHHQQRREEAERAEEDE